MESTVFRQGRGYTSASRLQDSTWASVRAPAPRWLRPGSRLYECASKLLGQTPPRAIQGMRGGPLRQSKHKQRLIIGAACSSRCGDYSDVLFSIVPEVCHRNRGDVVVQLHRPKFLSCFRFERAETSVVGCADEEQTSRCHDGTTRSRRSNILLTRWQRLIKTERYLPRDVA